MEKWKRERREMEERSKRDGGKIKEKWKRAPKELQLCSKRDPKKTQDNRKKGCNWNSGYSLHLVVPWVKVK